MKANWFRKIFKSTIEIDNNLSNKINYNRISIDWNADPISPEIELNQIGFDLTMDIYLNHYAFENYKVGDKAKIRFINCSIFSLNTCNEEGYYYGQYRTNANELPWGEFYEIKSGLSRELPEPVVQLSTDLINKRHFLFFFKDETFECLADDFKVEFYNDIK